MSSQRIQSSLLKELLALKFEESLVRDTSQPCSCDFCDVTLKVIESGHDFNAKQEALQELKAFFLKKTFDFNQRHVSGANGCLCYLMSCSQSSIQTIQDRGLLNDFLLKVLESMECNGHELMKTAMENSMSCEFIESLLDSLDIDLKKKNRTGDSLVSLAVKSGQDTVVTILLSSGVDGLDIDLDGNCLLHFAHKFKGKSLWKKLIPRMKDCLNKRNEFPLQSMAENNVLLDTETFKKLIPSVHLLNTKNSKGNTLIQALFPFKDWFKHEFLQELISASSSLPVASNFTGPVASSSASEPLRPKKPPMYEENESIESISQSISEVNITTQSTATSNLNEPKTRHDTCFQVFKRKVFYDSNPGLRFPVRLSELINQCSSINDLVADTISNGQRVKPLYSACIERIVSKEVSYAIELTKILIEFGVDFNVRGKSFTKKNGDLIVSEKTSIHFLIMITGWEKCHWTPKEKAEVFQMILDSNADPHKKESNANDALKLAVLHRSPLEIIKVIAKKAVETDPGDLFTSRNRLGNTVFEECFIYSKEIHQFLKEVYKCYSPNVYSCLVQENQPLETKFQEFASRFPYQWSLIRDRMFRLFSVNQNHHEMPIYQELMERIINSIKFVAVQNPCQVVMYMNALLSLTKRFIELGVDFNRQHVIEGRTGLVFMVSHAVYFAKPRKIVYEIVRLMLSNGARVDIEDSDGNDALKHAVIKEFPLKGIQEMLEASEHQYNMLTSINKKGLTAIDMAKDDTVKQFLKERLSLVLMEKEVKDRQLNCRDKVNEFLQKHLMTDFDQ